MSQVGRANQEVPCGRPARGSVGASELAVDAGLGRVPLGLDLVALPVGSSLPRVQTAV